MRALIYGGRDWDNQPLIDAFLDEQHAIHGFTEVINGGQISRRGDHLYGADWQADVWAQARGIPVRRFYANWSGEGKKAGPLRNQRMADEKPDIGIEFPGGAGTRDMRRRLKCPVIEWLTTAEIAW